MIYYAIFVISTNPFSYNDENGLHYDNWITNENENVYI